MNVFELGAKIGLDASAFRNGLQTAEGQMSAFGSAFKSGVSALANAAVTATKQAADASLNFVKTAVGVGAQFDTSMSQVAATMGKTVDEIGELRDFAQKMGSETSFSASQAADALNYMALAGYDAGQSMNMLPTVLDLAAAGSIGLAEASDMVTDSQSALGLSMEETTVMVDQMAKASSKTNTSVAQLGSAILTVGGTAKNLKGGTQELTQVLGLLADNGIKASEAGTHLRNIMLAMNPTTDDAVAAWERLGVEAYDSSGSLRNLSDIFTDLNAAMEGMSDQEKTGLITDMFNKTDLSSVNALLATNAERWNEVSEAIGNSEGAAAQMAETQLDNLNGDVTLLQSAFEGLQIAVADKVIPVFRPFIQLVSQLMSSVTKIIKDGGSVNDVVKKVIEGVDGMRIRLMQIVEKIIPAIAEEAPKIIDTLIKEFTSKSKKLFSLGLKVLESIAKGIENNKEKIADTARSVIQMLTTFISNNLPPLLSAGLDIILAVADAIITSVPELIPAVIEVITTIADKLMDVDMIESMLEAAVQIITTISEGLAENLPELIPKAVDMILTLVETLTNPDMIGQLVDAALVIIMAVANGLIKALPRLLEKAPVIVSNLVKAIKANAPKLLDAALELIKSIVNGITSNLNKIFDSGLDIVKSLLDGGLSVMKSIKEWGEKIGEEIYQAIKSKFNDILIAGKDIVNKFGDGIKDRYFFLKDVAHGLMDIAQNIIKDRLKGAWEWGKDMVSNFIEGIKSKWNHLREAVTGTADIVDNNMGFSLPEEGPLSDFDKSAPDMMDLFIKGIKDNEMKLRNQIQKTFDFQSLIQMPDAEELKNISVATKYDISERSYRPQESSASNVTNITINVQTGVVSNDYGAHRLAKKISEQLAILENQNRKAVGV